MQRYPGSLDDRQKSQGSLLRDTRAGSNAIARRREVNICRTRSASTFQPVAQRHEVYFGEACHHVILHCQSMPSCKIFTYKGYVCSPSPPDGRREVAKPAKQFRPVLVSVVFSCVPEQVQMDMDVDDIKTGAGMSGSRDAVNRFSHCAVAPSLAMLSYPAQAQRVCAMKMLPSLVRRTPYMHVSNHDHDHVFLHSAFTATPIRLSPCRHSHLSVQERSHPPRRTVPQLRDRTSPPSCHPSH